MHLFLKLATLLILVTTVSDARAQTQVRVVTVYESGANISNVVQQMLNIQVVINNTPNLTFTIDHANQGIPIQLIGNINGSTNENQRLDAIATTSLVIIRNSVDADIVMAFVDQLPNDDCGWAAQFNWTDNGSLQLTGGLDLTGSETYFVGLVSTSNDCRTRDYMAAHEFGHLFGAAHELESFAGPGLHSDSYADFIRPAGLVNGRETVMNTIRKLFCGALSCDMIPQYSALNTATSHPNFTSGFENWDAINDTKESVSHYRNPVSCGLTRPHSVTGSLKDPCDPEPFTQYNLDWEDDCPMVTDKYEIWKNQPFNINDPYVYGWDVFPHTSSEVVFVSGQPAGLKVKACVGGLCTFESSSFYVAGPQCDDFH